MWHGCSFQKYGMVVADEERNGQNASATHLPGPYPRLRRHNVQQTVERTCLLPPEQKRQSSAKNQKEKTNESADEAPPCQRGTALDEVLPAPDGGGNEGAPLHPACLSGAEHARPDGYGGALLRKRHFLGRTAEKGGSGGQGPARAGHRRGRPDPGVPAVGSGVSVSAAGRGTGGCGAGLPGQYPAGKCGGGGEIRRFGDFRPRFSHHAGDERLSGLRAGEARGAGGPLRLLRLRHPAAQHPRDAGRALYGAQCRRPGGSRMERFSGAGRHCGAAARRAPG